MLHTLNLDGWETTPWCVPSAFAAITGVSVAQAHSIAAFSTGRSIDQIEGMVEEEIHLLAHRFRIKLLPIPLENRFREPPRLRDFVPGGQTPLERVIPCLITLADRKTQRWHMVAAHHGYLVDNWVKRPTPISTFPRTYRHVTQAWTTHPQICT